MEKHGSHSFMSPRCEIHEEALISQGSEIPILTVLSKVLDPASFPRARASYIYSIPEPKPTRDRPLTQAAAFAPPLTPVSSICSPSAPPCSLAALPLLPHCSLVLPLCFPVLPLSHFLLFSCYCVPFSLGKGSTDVSEGASREHRGSTEGARWASAGGAVDGSLNWLPRSPAIAAHVISSKNRRLCCLETTFSEIATNSRICAWNGRLVCSMVLASIYRVKL